MFALEFVPKDCFYTFSFAASPQPDLFRIHKNGSDSNAAPTLCKLPNVLKRMVCLSCSLRDNFTIKDEIGKSNQVCGIYFAVVVDVGLLPQILV